MIRKFSLAAIVLSTIALSPLATAQVIDSGWGVPSYNEFPIWQSTDGLATGFQGYDARPYVPYPGQPGYTGAESFPINPLPVYGQGQAIESFSQPAGGYVQPLVEIPQSQPSSLQGSGTNQEIIISEEPVDGRIIGVVKADGSIVPIGQAGSATQSAPSVIESPNPIVSSGDPMAEDKVGNSVVVEPGVLIVESEDSPTEDKDPGMLAASAGEAALTTETTRATEAAPAESPESVADAMMAERRMKETTQRMRGYETRVREMDQVIKGLKAENEELKAASEKGSKALADLLVQSETAQKKALKVEQEYETRIAEMEKIKEEFGKKLKASKESSMKSNVADTEVSKLRKKLVDANRLMVKMRQSLNSNEEQMETILRRRTSREAKLSKDLAESNKEMSALKNSAREIQSKLRSMADKEAQASKMKKELAASMAESKKLKAKLAAVAKSKTSAADYRKKYDELKKTHSKTVKQQRAAKTQISELTAKLKVLDKKLTVQEQLNKKMKAEFIEAYEADKKKKAKSKKSMTEAEVREALEKKRKEAARKEKKEGESKETESEKKSTKSKKSSKTRKEKLREREKELREEMKKKMAAAESRIRAVGKKKVDALLAKGKKEDSDDVKAEKKRTEDSIRISDRKIRARYERKIKRLK